MYFHFTLISLGCLKILKNSTSSAVLISNKKYRPALIKNDEVSQSKIPLLTAIFFTAVALGIF